MIQTRKPRDVRAEKLDEARDAGIKVSADGIERLEGLLAYTAMMVDVELPEDEEGDGNE